jgi:hypothetical protein
MRRNRKVLGMGGGRTEGNQWLLLALVPSVGPVRIMFLFVGGASWAGHDGGLKVVGSMYQKTD